MKAFDPSVGDVIRLFGDEFVLQEHPAARGMVFAAEAGRATVYQVRDRQRRPWALKVFFPKFRTPRVIESTKHLRSVESFEGLMAASRRVVTPDEGDARTIPELHYSVLMHWVPGRTWYDLLEIAGSSGREKPIHRITVARQLTSRFLTVMDRLEESGIAHTDISAGNVTVEHNAKDTQLLDLEDMYLPQGSAPVVTTTGTPGYSHPNVISPENTWQAAGDRYATAVLSAELLLMANKQFAKDATSNGYFTGHRNDPPAQSRFTVAEPYLRDVAPSFAKLVVEAWTSDSLKACPRIRQLHEAARKDWSTIRVPTPAGTKPTTAPVQDPVSTSAPPPDRGRVWFEKESKVSFSNEPAAPRVNAPKRPATPPAPPDPPPSARPQQPGSTRPRVYFESSPVPPQTTTPPAATPAPGSSPRTATVIAWLIVIALLLIWLADNSR